MTAAASTLNHRPTAQPVACDSVGAYCFQVVAGSVADAVTSIGGLIFDRAMAGWEVGVVIVRAGPIDDRPVRILGAHLQQGLTDPHPVGVLRRPQLIAVATDVMANVGAVRRQVLGIGESGAAEILLWGRYRPIGIGRAFVAAEHRPSAAARVFTSYALAAAGAPRADPGNEDVIRVWRP